MSDFRVKRLGKKAMPRTGRVLDAGGFVGGVRGGSSSGGESFIPNHNDLGGLINSESYLRTDKFVHLSGEQLYELTNSVASRLTWEDGYLLYRKNEVSAKPEKIKSGFADTFPDIIETRKEFRKGAKVSDLEVTEGIRLGSANIKEEKDNVVFDKSIVSEREVVAYAIGDIRQDPTLLGGAEYLSDLLDVKVLNAPIDSILCKVNANEWGYIAKSSISPDLSRYVLTNDSRLSNARPASDVYDWAKQPTKPSYNKSDVGLTVVDNTSDENKPISAATRAELNKKALKTDFDTHNTDSIKHITSNERSNWNDANAKKHEHSNKLLLDKLDQDVSTKGNVRHNSIVATAEVVAYAIGAVRQEPIVVGGAEYLNDLLDVSVLNAPIGSLLCKTSTNEWSYISKDSLRPDLSKYIVNTDSRLSDARPASDVYDWAKQLTKPSYTKSEVGLDSVDNTSDVAKPISTAASTALAKKLDKSGKAADSALLDGKSKDWYVASENGGITAIGGDLNNLNQNSIATFDGSISNTPEDTANVRVLTMGRDGRRTQLCSVWDSGNLYNRINNGVWQSWRKIWDSGNANRLDTDWKMLDAEIMRKITFRITDTGTFAGYIIENHSDMNNGGLSFYGVKNTSLFEAFRFNHDGNIGIGISTPTEKLDVDGNIKSRGSIYGVQLISDNLGLALYNWGSMWISGKTATNCIYGIKQSNDDFKSIIRTNTANDHVLTYGGLGDNVGFYGYLASLVVNGTSHSFTCSVSTGDWTCTNKINAHTLNTNSGVIKFQNGVELYGVPGYLAINKSSSVRWAQFDDMGLTINQDFSNVLNSARGGAINTNGASNGNYPVSIFEQNGWNFTIQNSANGQFGVWSSARNTKFFHIGNTGNIGIGTASPTEKLDVAGIIKTRALIVGTCKFYNGRDIVNSVDAFLKIGSWNGIGFTNDVPNQNVPVGENAVWIDTRGGDLSARRDVSVGRNLSVARNVLIDGSTTSNGEIFGNASSRIGGGSPIDILTKGAFRSAHAEVTSSGSSNNMLNWSDHTNHGYYTRYTIGSYRYGAGWGRMMFSIGKSDDGTQCINHFMDTQGLEINGNIKATGEVTAYAASDLRLKKNIISLSNCLDRILMINPISFNWNNKAIELNPSKNDTTDYGVIAQELNVVLPDLVHKGIYGEDLMSVDYIKIIPFLIGAIKEQQFQINNLKIR